MPWKVNIKKTYGLVIAPIFYQVISKIPPQIEKIFIILKNAVRSRLLL